MFNKALREGLLAEGNDLEEVILDSKRLLYNSTTYYVLDCSYEDSQPEQSRWSVPATCVCESPDTTQDQSEG